MQNLHSNKCTPEKQSANCSLVSLQFVHLASETNKQTNFGFYFVTDGISLLFLFFSSSMFVLQVHIAPTFSNLRLYSKALIAVLTTVRQIPSNNCFPIKSRLLFPFCSEPISQLRVLLTEKQSGEEIRVAAVTVCGGWSPAGEKHTDAFSTEHHLPATQNQPATSDAHKGGSHDSMRLHWGGKGVTQEVKREGGGRWEERLLMCNILGLGIRLSVGHDTKEEQVREQKAKLILQWFWRVYRHLYSICVWFIFLPDELNLIKHTKIIHFSI